MRKIIVCILFFWILASGFVWGNENLSPGDVVHLINRDLGIPAHAEPGKRDVSLRFGSESKVDVLKIDGKTGWVLVKDSESRVGWITKRYIKSLNDQSTVEKSYANADDFGRKGNTSIQSFNKAKKTLLRQVYHDHQVTFYCDCPFSEQKQLLPCDHYTPKKINARSKRIEWEHVVPAADFGNSFVEWREGHSDCVDSKGKSFKGRKCAEKMNTKYRYMQSDMFNLYPAIGEINGLRSNYRYDMIAGENREFGPCDFEIEGRVAEPPEQVRGDIARTYQYMDTSYPGHGIIGKANKKLYQAWGNQDPVDEWECERCRRIEAIQGNENIIVKDACKKAGLWKD